MSTSFQILDGNGKICSRSRLVVLWAVVATIIGFSLMIALIVKNNQLPPQPRERPVIRWCTTTKHEQEKCEQFSRAMNTSSGLHTLLECDAGSSVQDCVDRLAAGRSHAITLDGGLIAKHRDSVRPIVAEDYGEGPANYWAVAVAKTSTHTSVNLTSEGMSNKKACHTGYEKTAGWYFPIGTLMSKGIISPPDIDDCNPLSLAEDLFQSMCVPGAQSDDACELCPGSCESCNDGDYCGYTGAFRCLVEAGDVAFIKHSTVLANTDGNNEDDWAAGLRSSDFQLLCLDGTRAPVTAYAECSLGRAPSHAVVISNDASADLVPRVQEFLEVAELHFGYGVSDDDFQLFGGAERDLLFKSSTKRLLPLTEVCDTDAFLGEEYLNALSFVDNCVKDNITISNGECLLPQYREESYEKLRWCVISDKEVAKCEALQSAIASQEIKTQLQLSCILGSEKSTEECAKLISENDADVVSLDGGEIFRFSRRYNLQPVAAELYTGQGNIYESAGPGRMYYAVAVVHNNDSDPFNFTNLEDRKTCHTGYGKTAGWIMPIGTLASQGQITFDAGTCDVVDKVAAYFNASCVPNLGDRDSSGKLCSLCKEGDCSNDEFSGYSGAFKCLNEGGGDVAFIKHTTINDEDADPSLYQLLCPDGTRAAVSEYKNCNLAEVPAHALMTAPRNTVAYREKVWSLLDKLQKFAGGFDLFESSSYDGKDLLFKDSTQCIGKVDQTCNWQDFLGKTFFDAAREVQCVNNPPAHEYQHCQVSTCL